MKDVNNHCMRGYGAGIDLFTPEHFLFGDGLYVVIGYYDINPETVLEVPVVASSPIYIQMYMISPLDLNLEGTRVLLKS